MSPHTGNSVPRYALGCRMSEEAAALERLCQVVRIRGFRISTMTMSQADGSIEISITVEGKRSVAMLINQLEKLHTVDSVFMSDALAVAHTG